MTELILDTNILLRFFTGDVPAQAVKVRRLFDQIEKGEIKVSLPILVIHELLWIGEHFYGLERVFVVDELMKILRLGAVRVEETSKGLTITLLERYAMSTKRVDFTDVYVAGIAGARKVVSFDKHLTKLGAKIYSD